MTPWTAARALAEALRAKYAAGTTGRQWKRPPHECPQWCAGGHHCSASYRRDGQHRSLPFTWPRPYGGLVITRTESGNAGVLELRAVVRTDSQRQAELLVTGIDMTIRAVLDAIRIDRDERPAIDTSARLLGSEIAR
jgi:hypothetical protein